MADEIITREELIDAKVDAKDLGECVNGNESGIVTPRLGDPYPTLPAAIHKIENVGGYISAPTLTALQAITPTYNHQVARVDATGDEYRWNPALTTTVKWEPTGRNFLSESKAYTDSMTSSITIIPISTITVKKDGTVTIPNFNAYKNNVIQAFGSTYSRKPNNVNRAEMLYYTFSTNTISFEDNKILPKSNDVFLIGIQYKGWFFTNFGKVQYENESNAILKLKNEVLNGRMDSKLPTSLFSGAGDNAAIAEINDSSLNLMGIYRAQKLEPTIEDRRGGFVSIDLANSNIAGTVHLFAALLVCDPTASFDLVSTTDFPRAYVIATNGSTESVIANFIQDHFTYLQISPTLRLYTAKFLNLEISNTSNTLRRLVRVNLGARVTSSTANPIYITGHWLSITNDMKSYNNDIVLNDIAYPFYDQISVSAVYNALYDANNKLTESSLKQSTNISVLQSKTGATIVDQTLRSNLLNPFKSVYIRLIGDSITWGVGATDIGATEPRSHSLSDARANLTGKSWANLLRAYIGDRYLSNAALISDSAGSGYFEKELKVPLSDSNLYLKDASGVSMPVITTGTNTSAFFGDFLRISTGYNFGKSLAFKFKGEKFRVLFAGGTAAGTNKFLDVYVDNVLTYSIDYTNLNTWNTLTDYINVNPNFEHEIRISNRSTDGGILFLEAICPTKKIRVANDGIIGTTSKEWQTSGSLYTGSINQTDDFVFIQLGTNDRSTTDKPLDAFKTYSWVKNIVADLKLRNKQVVLMAANAVTQNESSLAYTQADIANQMKKLADDLNVTFIDNFKVTQLLKMQNITFLSDGLHPSDVGYLAMFENIKETLNI